MKSDIVPQMKDVRRRVRQFPSFGQIRYEFGIPVFSNKGIEHQGIETLRRCGLSNAGIQIVRCLVECDGDETRISGCLRRTTGKQKRRQNDEG